MTVLMFVLGAVAAGIVSTFLYGSLLLSAEEKAYKKGFRDGERNANGKNRESDGTLPGM